MNRREFVRLTAATAAAAAVPGGTLVWAAAPQGSADEALGRLFSAILDAELDERPQFATSWGLDTGARAAARSRLGDYSPASRPRWIDSARKQLAQLSQIDRRSLSGASQLDFDVVSWQLEQRVRGGERFAFGNGPHGSYAPYSPYVFSQLTGAYYDIPDFLSAQHPLRVRADAEAYLARVSAFAAALDESTECLRQDAARGVLAPTFALDTGLAQLEALRAPAPGKNSLAMSLATRARAAGIAGEWSSRAASIIQSRVYPALDRQRAAIEALRPKATPYAGVWKLPDGEAFYAGALAFQTSTQRTPEDVHRYGLEEVSALTARLDRLLKAQGYSTGSVALRLDALARRPEQLYPNTDAGRAELLAFLNAKVREMRTRLPHAFGTLPAAPLEIVRVPAEIQDGAPNGYAQAPSLDGSRPGRFYINLKDTAEWPRFTLPTLAYHEALPGHQWQIATALESKDTPLLRRLTGRFAAYQEGWALYAEQLADELGAYEHDPLGRIGYVQSILFRAVRLVVDTGMHAKRWSRQRATDYMVQATALPRARVQREIDRYCVWPGQACSYKIGQAEWLSARERVKARAGAHFDLKSFHEVLRRGSMPLVELARLVQT